MLKPMPAVDYTDMKQTDELSVSQLPAGFGRRRFLAAAGALGVVGLAGCLDNTPDIPPVESLPRPVQGDADAPVTVTVFEDYMCPGCASFALNIAPTAKENYVETGDVRWEFYDFPIPVSSTLSYSAAEAARSVQNNVGMDAFWEFNQLFFQNQSSVSVPSDVYDLAAQVGADRETVQNEVRANVYRQLIDADKQTGIDQGVRGTPTVFVNGEYVENPVYSRLSAAIDNALSQ